ncbi:hypothetical protein PHMEG_00013271 [Phytophthora megakarya]|uniref:DDE Tnp4 domain-containing protein n=1 Tax=Phytophthora megakarya TaxID=4795 RepID=A0A225W744_9STRA|nr:hypothetical protein PHMEG_00013271 [Phytophthora megakarya]
MVSSQSRRSQGTNHPLSATQVAHDVSILSQLDADRQAQRESMSSVVIDRSNDEIDSPSPVYHSFPREDAANITAMTNFASYEFKRLLGYLRNHLRDRWNRPMDVTYMFLTTLKHSGTWDVVADVFKIKPPTFQKMMLSFATVLSLYLYESREVHDGSVGSGGNASRNYPSARNFFGRLCTLWSMCSDKYRRDKGNFDILFKACIALTNFHVRNLPLRSPDGANYLNYLKRLHVIGNDARTKRLLVQRRYREKSKLRLRRLLAANVERVGGTTQSNSSGDEGSEDFLRRPSEAFFKTG